MAYGLKYHFSITAHSGGRCVLDIEQKDYSGGSTDLGGLLQGITLERQGDNLVEQAIMKSALTFTLVDRDGGMWEEFFTADVTKYRVTLSLGGRTMWIGYVTPDSYQESLVYRGSVAITARDMIGHLADIPFSEGDFLDVDNHLLSVESFLSQAMLKCDCPMSVNLRAGSHYLVSEQGISVQDWLVDLRAFEGDSLYDAVEAILDSTGMCMRWEDGKSVAVTSIRDAGHLSGGRQNIVFHSQSGTRSLDPAYRMVDEVFKLEYAEGEETDWNDRFNAQDRLNGTGGWRQRSGLDNIIASRGDNAGYFGDMPDSEASLYSMLYCVPLGSEQGTIATKTMLIGADTPVTISFEVAHTFDSNKNALDTDENYEGGHTIPYSSLEAHLLEGRGHLPSGRLRYAVRWSGYDGTYRYFTQNGWSDSSYLFEETFAPHVMRDVQQYDQLWCPWSSHTIAVSLTTPSNAGVLEFLVYPFEHQFRISVTPTTTVYDTHTYWVRLGNFSIVPESSSYPQDIKTKVTFDESQNYTLKREPKLGICPYGLDYAGLCINAFYQQEYTAIEAVKKVSFGTGSLLPLPVYVALQHITMHSRPVSVVGGTIGVGEDEQIDLAGRWHWGGLDLYLCGGSFDPIHGVVNGAIMRETPAWQDITADYRQKNGDKDLQMQSVRDAIESVSNVTAGGSSGTGSGIEDAPKNGRTYGRKDGSWVTIESEQGSVVSWGEDMSQAVTLDVNGVSKLLSKSGHTHNNYVNVTTSQNIAGDKHFVDSTYLDNPYKGEGRILNEHEVDEKIPSVSLVDGEGVGVLSIVIQQGTTTTTKMVSTPQHNHDADYFSKNAGESLDTLVGQNIEDIVELSTEVGNLSDRVGATETEMARVAGVATDAKEIASDLNVAVGALDDRVGEAEDAINELDLAKAQRGECYTKSESDGKYCDKEDTKWGQEVGTGYRDLYINGEVHSVAEDDHTHANMVTIDGEQTITGNKTFQGNVLFDGLVSAGGNSITDVVDPTDPTDVANKAYVDAHIVDLDDVYTKIQADARFVAKQEGARLYTEADELMMRNAITSLGTAIINTEEGVKRYADNKFVEKQEDARLFTEADRREFRGLISTLGQYASALEERIYALEHAEQFIKLYLTSRYELSTYQYPRKFPNPNDGCIINCMTWNGYLYDGHPLDYRVVADDAVTINSNSYTNMAYKLGIPFRAEAGKTYRFSWQYLDADDNGTTGSRVELCYVGADGEIIDGDTNKYIEEGAGSFTVPAGCAWVILVLAGIGFDGDPATCYPMNWYDMKLKKM